MPRRLGWWKRTRLLRPYSVSVYWLGSAERWEGLRRLLLAERGLTEADVERLYETPEVPSPFDT